MSYAREMLEATPSAFQFDADRLVACIEACFDCAQPCRAGADACLGEKMVADLARCIRLDADCADVCQTTGRVLSRQTDYDATVTTALLRACAAACRACADECASHAAMHEHCRICAEACRRCEHACDGLVAAAG
jgi:hypothetical protein